MQQRFVLPENCSKIESVSYVNVKPQFQQEVVEGHVVLDGIYLIQVECRLGEGQCMPSQEGILIDEVDVDGNIAYFEYGLPLHRMLDGENLVTHFSMSPIEAVILPSGVLNISAEEIIERKPSFVARSVETEAQQVQEETSEVVAEKVGAMGIVEWLGLSNQYKTEKIQLNPVLKQRESSDTQNE